MKPFFTESDCDSYHVMGTPHPCISLDKANRLLSERGTVIYKQPGFCGHSWQENLHDAWNRTHTALLINIQPIEEDTVESLLKEIIKRWDNNSSPLDHSWPPVIERARKLVGK